MYTTHSNLIIAFHGCDQSLVNTVASGKEELTGSKNDYDWLGHGIYFWENNYERALKYAQDLKKHPQKSKNKITTPSVIGAVIDLGYCLDLLEDKSLQLLKESYDILKDFHSTTGTQLPENKLQEKNIPMLRYLDCAVINFLNQYQKSLGAHEFDSVRGVFVEGGELYQGSGFNEKNHIQICVRNPNCIKGYFIPREENKKFTRV
jgi:hypothetical protein